jgi:hypothetical protein
MKSYQRDLLQQEDHNHHYRAIPQNQRTSFTNQTKQKNPCRSDRTPLSQMAPGNDPVDARN